MRRLVGRERDSSRVERRAEVHGPVQRIVLSA